MPLVPEKRFLAQFRLRTLFALIAVISVPLAVSAWREHQYRLRLAAVAVLQNAGDRIKAESNQDKYWHRFVTADSGVMRRDEVVTEVEAGRVLSDDEISAILCLRTLRVLDLRGRLHRRRGASRGTPGILDRQLREITKLPFIKALDLEGTRVTDDGLRHLAAMRGLETLNLVDTCVTDDGVRHLANLPSLQELKLGHTKINGTALAHLSALPRLEKLFLGWNDIGDDSLQQLARIPTLVYLGLQGTRVSDEGLEALARSDSLRSLSLYECCRVSDAGLAHLGRMKALRSVDLEDTSVTAAGVARLKKLRPDLNIDWNETPEEAPTNDVDE